MRLPGWDYANPGAYFVTFNVAGRRWALGSVRAGGVRMSAAGAVVLDVWRRLPARFPGLALDHVVVMPDHVHVLLWIVPARDGAGVKCRKLCTSLLGVRLTTRPG